MLRPRAGTERIAASAADLVGKQIFPHFAIHHHLSPQGKTEGTNPAYMTYRR